MIIDFRSGKMLPKKNTAQEIKDIKAAEEIKLKKILDSLSKDSSCKCGVSPLPKSKIVNGKETPKDKYYNIKCLNFNYNFWSKLIFA